MFILMSLKTSRTLAKSNIFVISIIYSIKIMNGSITDMQSKIDSIIYAVQYTKKNHHIFQYKRGMYEVIQEIQTFCHCSALAAFR